MEILANGDTQFVLPGPFDALGFDVSLGADASQVHLKLLSHLQLKEST